MIRRGVKKLTQKSGNNLYQQNSELELLELLLPYLTHPTFLDIGAEQGEFTRFFSQHGLKGVFFEPLPQCEVELTKLAQDSECIFSSYAIDAYDRTADFYHAFDKTDTDAQYFSSLHPLQNDERILHKKVCTVQCRSLNSLLKEKLICQSIGIIKIDTEGNDLNVLKGMDEISTEILMCEFFMPNIYSGWELGHPKGLIQQAKQLGFNHFFSIKRIDGYEFISLDSDHFMDKQWGNLIFISDEIYKQSKKLSVKFIHERENAHIINLLAKTTALQNACDERLEVINNLQKICDARLSVKIKNWLPNRIVRDTSSAKR